MAKKYLINKGFVTQKIGKKITIFSGEESLLLTLNETAGFVFESLKKGLDKEKIVEKLADKYQIPRRDAAADVDNFLKELLTNKIIAFSKS